MNELEQLQQVKKELNVTFKLLQRQLKTYAIANVNYAGSKIKEVGNTVLEAYKNMQYKISEYKAVKQEQERTRQIEKEAEMNRKLAEKLEEQERRERTKEHVDAMKEILREQDRAKRQERIIKFKDGVVQKTNSIISKIGSIKTSVLENIMTTKNTFDLKIQNAFENAQLVGLGIAAKGMEKVNDVKNYASDQIEKIIAWKHEQDLIRQEKRAQREAEMNRKLAEKLEEQERRERTKEHADAMKEILKEQDRAKREERIIKFKDGVVQKTNSIISKIGSIKTSILKNIMDRKKDFDSMIENAFQNAQLVGHDIVDKGIEKFNNVKNYASDQIQKFSKWKAEHEKSRQVEQELEIKELEVLNEQVEQKNKVDHVETKKENLEEQKLEENVEVSKADSTKSKIGSIKTSVLENILGTKKDFDSKIQNVFQEARLVGIAVADNVVEKPNTIKNYASDQIEKIIAWKHEQDLIRQEKRAQREAEMNRKLAEKLEEQERRERTKEHAEAMKEILREQDRAKRQERIIKFKDGVVQKTNSIISKIGSVKTSVLENIMTTKNTFDLKIQNTFEKAQLVGLGIATKGMEKVNDVKNYASDQIEKIIAWKHEQDLIRQEKRAQREAETNRKLAEKLEEQERRERTKEHAEAMKEILREQDRKALLEEQAEIRKKLIQQKEFLIAEKEKLLGNSVQNDEQVYEGKHL